jgi:hypothetical protein
MTMTTSTMQFRSLALAMGKIAIALGVASVMSGISVKPAQAEGFDKRDGQAVDGHVGREEHGDQRDKHQDNGRHRGERGERERDHDRREYQRPGYYYPQTVYAPAPVEYAPRPSAGISLFLPLDIHVR